MILALAYIVLGAKPISIRRLFLLYVFTVAMAASLLASFRAEHAASLSSQIAIVVTLAVWSYPIVRVVHDLFRGHFGLKAFEPVSICVQATYGLAAVIAFALGLKAFVSPFDAPTLAVLSRIVAVGIMGSVGLTFFGSMLRTGPHVRVSRVVPSSVVYQQIEMSPQYRIRRVSRSRSNGGF
jgi:hypothetical protein